MKLKKYLLLIIFSLGMTVAAVAQSLITNPSRTLTLSMNGEEGTRGASVTWNPKLKYYYAVFAGNADYPMETFSSTGDHISTLKATSDMRGIWWNKKTKQLEGNCYSDAGTVKIDLSASGFAGGSSERINKDSYQPNAHAVGDYDAKKKMIIYLDGNTVVKVDRATGKSSSTLKLSLPTGLGNINETSVVYTGKKKMEYAVFNHSKQKVYLFNSKTGELTGTVQLPNNVPQPDSFNFSFANNHVFLFDTRARKWYGFKIF